MKRVLVVGAGSPLGLAVVASLIAAGHHVDRTTRDGRDGSIPLDLRDCDSAASVLHVAYPEVVVLLARPHLPAIRGDAAIDEAVDHARAFARASRIAGVERIVFASSAAVYGTAASEPRRESDSTSENSPYAKLKLRTERALAQELEGSVAARIFNVYGDAFPESLVTRLVASATNGSLPSIHATDDFARDYVHVDDVAASLAAIVSASEPLPVVNIGTGVATGNLALVRLFPRARWTPAASLSSPSISVADTALLRSAVGFVPPPRLTDYAVGHA